MIMEQYFKTELMDQLYAERKSVQLWEDSYQDKPLSMYLSFHAGQRKEGCLSLMMTYENQAL